MAFRDPAGWFLYPSAGVSNTLPAISGNFFGEAVVTGQKSGAASSCAQLLETLS